ncbi:hypothetical protein I0E98_19470 [Pseudomonas lalucatii]|nr:hypothetical protein [Pseudomonas lalucatii]
MPPVRAPGSTAPAPSVSANAAAPARTAEPEPPAHASLDLSVPPELLEQANTGGEGEHGLTPLLPPLFEAKAEAGPVQLSGRLITEEAGDWNSLEGAELQFELRR